jgi:hypothetical protein
MIVKLGDIIRIIAPKNEELHEQMFYIDYIDETKIKLLNISTETLTEHILTVKDNSITDESIEELELLRRSTEKGYARQHGFIPSVWLDIHFGGEIPSILTGEITNIENDMIELTTFPERQTIYIDFEYKGLPEYIPIVKFVIREKPSSTAVANALQEAATATAADEAAAVDVGDAVNVGDATEVGAATEEDHTPEPDLRQQIKNFVESSDIFFGNVLEAIVEQVEVRKGEERYGLDTQINDFMDELLSTIPAHKRTEIVMRDIHNTIERFKKLREIFSIFDENGVIVGKKKNGANYKPIIEHIVNLDTKLKWLIPVVSNARKLYKIEDDGIADPEVEDITTVLKKDETDKDAVYYKNITQNPFSNKYADLLKTTHPNPFHPPEHSRDLMISNVKTNLETIVENIDDLYSGVVKDQSMGAQRNVVLPFVTGETILEPTDNTEVIVSRGIKLYKRSEITPGDEINIKSFIMLPEPVARFSAIHLPNTNIITKSNLNFNYFNIWRLLKKRTFIDRKVIRGSAASTGASAAAEEGEGSIGAAAAMGEDEQFLKTICEYTLDENDMEAVLGAGAGAEGAAAAGTTNMVKMMDGIIPKTKTLFNKIKPYIHDKYTFVDVVKFLEPFLIYNTDISYKQYTFISKFLRTEIQAKKRNYIEDLKLYNTIRTSFKTMSPPTFMNSIYDFLSNANSFEVLMKIYDIVGIGAADPHDSAAVAAAAATQQKATILKQNRLTSAEILHKMVYLDYGMLFMNTLANMNMGLTTPEDVLKLVEEFQIKDIGELEKLTPADAECNTRRFAKKYNSPDALAKDTGVKEIFYDKEYDNTPMDILEDEKIKDKRRELKPADFQTYLKKTLTVKYNFAENLAAEHADSLIRGKKLVKEGDFAIVIHKNPAAVGEGVNTLNTTIQYIEYYRRRNSAWVKDDQKLDVESSIGECNIDNKCITGTKDGQCHSMEFAANHSRRNMHKKILDEFAKRSTISIAELRRKLEAEIAKNVGNMRIIKTLKSLNERRANQVAFRIGKTLNNVNEHNIVSPYEKLRNVIFAQSDFTKKQNDILKFVQKYCREPLAEQLGEESYWMYCAQTNTKLVPMSIYRLADEFINGTDYATALSRICAEYGDISEDGDSIVDRYSGYSLRKIDFIAMEGYDEAGYKIVTHEVLEDTMTMEERVTGGGSGGVAAATTSNVAPPKKKIPRVFEGEFAEQIYNISRTLAANMSIPYELMEEIVLQNTPKILETKLPKKETYNKTELSKKIPFDTYKNQMTIWVTAGMVVLAVQCAIPTPQIKKTFPQCIRSFTGYPIDGGVENMTALEYITCVINKTKSTISPWNSIKSISKHVDKIKTALDKFILVEPRIQTLIQTKKEYLAGAGAVTEEEAFAPAKHRIQKWLHFLPPLVPIHLGIVKPISAEFKREYISVIRQGRKEQREQYGILQGKLMQYSAAIVEAVNHIVQKREPLLKTASNTPFLENTCCHGDGKDATGLVYFARENGDIVTYIKNTRLIAATVNDIGLLSKPAILFYTTDTTHKYPVVVSDYNKPDIIYDTIIQYCKYGTDIPTPVQFLPICPAKIDGFKRSWGVEEKIDFLRKHGRVFKYEDLIQIVNLSNKANIINVKSDIIADLRVLRYREMMAEEDGEGASASEGEGEGEGAGMKRFAFLEGDGEQLKRLLLDATEGTEVGAGGGEKTDILNRYLSRTTHKMYDGIKSFFRKNKISQKDYTKYLVNFLENLTNWKTDELKNNNLDYYKNAILFMAKIFPNAFINENINPNKVIIHEHWDLSPIHSDQLEQIVIQYGEKNGYSANKNVIKKLLVRISGIYENIDMFIERIAFFNITTRTLLYSFLWFSILFEYIQTIQSTVNRNIRNVRRDAEIERGENDEYFAAGGETVDSAGEDSETTPFYEAAADSAAAVAVAAFELTDDNEDVLGGNIRELEKSVYDIFMVFLKHSADMKNTLNQTYDEIYEKVTESKNREKEKIKRLLQDMTIEERKVEQELMKLKMGAWKTGKEIFKYDKNYYDREIQNEQMEENEQMNAVYNFDTAGAAGGGGGGGGRDILTDILGENYRTEGRNDAIGRDSILAGITNIPEDGEENDELQEEQYITIDE